MAEKGFYHPDRGYWQTTGEPPKHVLDGYPAGTVEVPIKPGDGYEFDGKKWVAPDAATIAAENLAALRAKRDAALSASDWTQMPDSPLSDADKQAWATYRQALRDLPETGDTWPSKPGSV